MFSPSHLPVTPRTALFFIGIMVAFGALMVAGAPQALANGGGDTSTIFEEQVEGYQVVVTSTPGNPTAGLVHFTFSISDAATREIITGAALALSVTPPEDSELEPNSFSIDRSTVNPNLYDVNVDMDAEGVWNLALSIDGPLGLAEASFPLEIRGPASKIFAILIVVLAFPILLAMLEVWRRWDRRRKRAQQNGGSDVVDTDIAEQHKSC